MTKKHDNIHELLAQTAQRVTSSEQDWLFFLSTAARLYKYKVEDQLLIYAQRPDATACASYKFWNERMGRWIKGGARGIALIDDQENHSLKYVFDVTDTRTLSADSKPPYLWKLKEEYQQPVLEQLQKTYDVTGQNFAETLFQLSEYLAKDLAQELSEDLDLIGRDSIFESHTAESRRQILEKTAASSIAYVMLKRCDQKPDQYLSRFDFSGIRHFQTAEQVALLGYEVNTVCREALIQMGIAIRAQERELARDQQKEYDAIKEDHEGREGNEVRIPKERGLSNPEPSNKGSTQRGYRQVRQNEENLPAGRKTSPLYSAGSERGSQGTSSGSERASKTEDRPIDRATSSSGSGAREKEGSDSLDVSHELDQAASRRTGFTRDSLQLSLFPSVQEQKKQIQIKGAEPAPFSMPQEKRIDIPTAFITEVLKHGTESEYGKTRIVALYEQDISAAARRWGIKKEYGDSNLAWPLDGEYGVYGCDTSPKGILVKWVSPEGDPKEGLLSWHEVEEQIQFLIQAGIYITEYEQENIVKHALDDIEADIISLEQADDLLLNDEDTEKSLKVAQQMGEMQNHVNFQIQDDALGEGTKREKCRWNLEAIKRLKELESRNEVATLEEQEALHRYVGWGGLPDVFDETKDNWKSEYMELKELLSQGEYISARESTLNAHYTSPVVIQAMYKVLERLGFQGGNISEPALGIGNFFGCLPQSMKESRLYGSELDEISARIAKQLYPDAEIQASGYQNTAYPDNFFDVVIGNVPFGDYKVSDPKYNKHGFRIHDYFFAKAIDQVRPGGIIAFITFKGTMDKQNPKVRSYLAERAKLIGAIRLPNTAFKANAGTEVTSDILFLQKRDRPVVIDQENWVHLGKNENGLVINEYFISHPEMIVGEVKEISGPYGPETACILQDNADLKHVLHQAVNRISGQYEHMGLDALDAYDQKVEGKILPADPNVRNYSYTMAEDAVYFRENSVMTQCELSGTAEKRVRGMIELRNCVREIIWMQMENYPDSVIKEQQKVLNVLYDRYTNKYGLLNSRGNKLAFDQDASYPLLCSLEDIDESFDFLGFNIRKFKGVLLTQPSKKSVKKFLDSIRYVIDSNKSCRQETLIRLLNPKITGWANYYRCGASSRTFRRIDDQIYRKLWQWAKRRHPKKGNRWIANKYFHFYKTRRWRFLVESTKNGKQDIFPLKLAFETKIIRHKKIKSEANPFDVEWNDYFEERKTYKMLLSLKGRNSLLYMWNKQERKCPLCGQPITAETQ